MKEMVKYGIILGAICLIASGVLAVVNAVTEPQIDIQKEKAENLALREVMPDCSDFKPVLDGDKIAYFRAYDTTNKLKGFVIKAEGKGYSSNIETMASVNLNLEIINVKVLSQNETPGLGTRVAEQPFLVQFKGKDLSSLAKVNTITGATISSSAVIKSVKDKITELKDPLLKDANAR